LDPTASTRVQVCGRLVVVWDGRRIEDELPSRQGRLLFAHLVTHRKAPASRAQLIDALWPDGPPPGADGALRVLLSKLRRLLGAEALRGKDEPYLALPPDAYVDLDAAGDKLHDAESAAALGEWVRAWAPARAALHTADRGFLRGHDAPWIDEIRRSLEDVRLRALDCVAAVGLGLRGPELGSAERAARALIDSAPYRESGYLHLMRALAMQDNAAEAIRVYDRLRCLLRDELGIAPGERAQELHGRLLDGSAARA
jgi:DNA-binding SARP family transcriptional activator